MNTNAIISELKSFNEDHEFYPTTIEIIEAMHKDLISVINDGFSILDCGAGNGKVLTELKRLGELHQPKFGSAIKPTECYAIEKSPILLGQLPKDVFVVGTDFWANTIIDKQTDIVFSNPMYSQFEDWFCKLVREANARYVYGVLPSRWVKSSQINNAIEAREGKVEVVGSFDFLDSEDRKARAKVDLVRVQLCRTGGWNHKSQKVDPFDLWFDDNFKKTPKKEEGGSQQEKRSPAQAKKELIKALGLVEALEQLYQKELKHLLHNYQTIQSLDSDLINELGVSKQSLVQGLKQKISGLKSKFWKELFSNLTKITSRLTSSSRERIMSKLFASTHVDFSVSNIHAVVEFVIKNSNSYLDSQIITIFERMINKASIVNFVSNKRVFSNNEWMYCRTPKGLSHVKLDLQIVVEDIGGIYTGGYPKSDSINGLNKSAITFLDDLLTIANNLGFTTESKAEDFDWSETGAKEFMFKSLKTGKEEVLIRAKAFKNQNIHIKFNQAFICALNIEMARLKGWIQNSTEAASEMGYSEELVNEFYKSNFRFLPTQNKALLFAA